MAFIQKETTYDWYSNIIESSSSVINTAEKMLKNKREELERIKYELELLETNAYIKYKQNVMYDYSFYPLMLEKAWKWCGKSKKDKAENKKCEEKERYKDLEKEIKKQFDRNDIKITEILQYCYGIGYSINFKIGKYIFMLHVPIVPKVSMDEYIRTGGEAFKLQLRYEKSKSYWDFIGSTFEEEELKDILNKWLEDKEIST